MHNATTTNTKKITDIIIISVVTTTYNTKVIHPSFYNRGHKHDNNEQEMNQTTLKVTVTITSWHDCHDNNYANENTVNITNSFKIWLPQS